MARASNLEDLRFIQGKIWTLELLAEGNFTQWGLEQVGKPVVDRAPGGPDNMEHLPQG